MKKTSQSIFDTLIRLMPDLAPRLQSHGDYVDPSAANSLFSIWRSEKKLGNRTYRRPPTMGVEELRRMKDAGLIQLVGDQVQITDKGSKIIRIMVLGDDRSIFEDSDKLIDYTKALRETKGLKTAKRLKAAQKEPGWWDRFEPQPEAKYQCKCGAEYDELPTKRVGDEIYPHCPACGGGQFVPDPYE